MRHSENFENPKKKIRTEQPSSRRTCKKWVRRRLATTPRGFVLRGKCRLFVMCPKGHANCSRRHWLRYHRSAIIILRSRRRDGAEETRCFMAGWGGLSAAIAISRSIGLFWGWVSLECIFFIANRKGCRLTRVRL